VEGSLDIYTPKNTKAVPELQRIFARTILKLDTLADGTIGKRVYDLDPLADPSFEFVFPPDSGIGDATVTKIRLTLKHGAKRRILLEADTHRDPKAVYDLLKALSPPPYYVTRVSIKKPSKNKLNTSACFALGASMISRLQSVVPLTMEFVVLDHQRRQFSLGDFDAGLVGVVVGTGSV
jgi:hypothetical protein